MLEEKFLVGIALTMMKNIIVKANEEAKIHNRSLSEHISASGVNIEAEFSSIQTIINSINDDDSKSELQQSFNELLDLYNTL